MLSSRRSWDNYRWLRWIFAVMHGLNFMATMTFAAAGRFVDFGAPVILLFHAVILVLMHADESDDSSFFDVLRRMAPRWNSVVLRVFSSLFMPAATSLVVDRMCDDVLASRLSNLNATPPTKPTPLQAAMHTAECLSDNDDGHVRSSSQCATVLATIAVVVGTSLQYISLIAVPNETWTSSSPVAVVAVLMSTVTGFGLCITVTLWKVARPELGPSLTMMKSLLATLDGLLLLAVLFDPITLNVSLLSSTQVDGPDEGADVLRQLWWWSAVTSLVSLAVVTLLLFVRHVILDDDNASTPLIERAAVHFVNLILLCILLIVASCFSFTLRFTWLLFYVTTWTAGGMEGDRSASTTRLCHVLTAFLAGDGDDASAVARRCAFAVSELHRHLSEHRYFSESYLPSARGFYLLTTFLSTDIEALAAMDGARVDTDSNGVDMRERMLPDVLTMLGMKLRPSPNVRCCVADAHEILLVEPEVREVLDAYHSWRGDVPEGAAEADCRCTLQWGHDCVLEPQRVVRLLSAVVEPCVYACGCKAWDESAEEVLGKEGCRWLKAWARYVWIPLHVVLCGGSTAALLVGRVLAALVEGVRDPFAAVQVLCALGCVAVLAGIALELRSFLRNVTQTQRLVSALLALVPHFDVDEHKLYRALLQYEADPDGAEGPPRRCLSTCCTIPMEVLPFRRLRDVVCRYC